VVVRWTVVALVALAGVLLTVDGYALIGSAVVLGAAARATFLARLHIHPERRRHRNRGYDDPG
jgi:hypothetical protein